MECFLNGCAVEIVGYIVGVTRWPSDYDLTYAWLMMFLSVLVAYHNERQSEDPHFSPHIPRFHSSFAGGVGTENVEKRYAV